MKGGNGQELVNNVAQKEGVTEICHIKSKISVVRDFYAPLLVSSPVQTRTSPLPLDVFGYERQYYVWLPSHALASGLYLELPDAWSWARLTLGNFPNIGWTVESALLEAVRCRLP